MMAPLYLHSKIQMSRTWHTIPIFNVMGMYTYMYVRTPGNFNQSVIILYLVCQLSTSVQEAEEVWLS